MGSWKADACRGTKSLELRAQRQMLSPMSRCGIVNEGKLTGKWVESVYLLETSKEVAK